MADPTADPATAQRDGSSTSMIQGLAVLAVLIAVGYLAWRGVWRGANGSSDLAVGFSAARAWILGHDPYDPVILNGDFLAGGGGALADGALLDSLRNVYFPTTILVFLPLAALSWEDARTLTLVINVLASVFIAVGVSRLVGWRLTSARSLLASAFIMALAPLHTTMAFGQSGIIATSAIIAAMLLERSGHRYATGFAFGLATIIKVQIGLPFLAYLLWRRRWAPAASAFATFGAVGALSVIRLQLSGTPWLDSWLANLAKLSGPGGINDPSLQNPDRFSLIDLQYLLGSITVGGPTLQVVGIALIGAAAVAFVWLHRGRDSRPDLLALSIVTVLGLLAAYHRYYDAVLLVIPIAWACSMLDTSNRRFGWIVLILCADFLLPFQSLVFEVEQRGWVPASLSGNPIWTAVLVTQHVWALVMIAIVVLVVAARDRRDAVRGVADTR